MNHRNYRGLIFLFPVLLISFIACSDKAEIDGEAAVPVPTEESILKQLTINEKTENVLYSYMDEKGAYQTVENSEEVPDPCRNDVIVVNLNLPPEQRLSATKVIVADLETKEGGYFKLAVKDRAGFEKALKLKRKWRLSPPRKPLPGVDLSKQAPSAMPAAQRDGIVLYTASWCGYCKRARKFFKQNGIPFIEKDIEKDQNGAVEMQTKCAMAGLECNGVPVIDWQGRMIPGFDQAMVAQLMKSSPPKAAKTAPAKKPKGGKPSPRK